MKYRAMSDLKESYVHRRFNGFRKAVKCSYKARRYRTEFWTKVQQLYKGINGATRYDEHKQAIIMEEEASK